MTDIGRVRAHNQRGIRQVHGAIMVPRLPRTELQARLQEVLGIVGDDPGDAA